MIANIHDDRGFEVAEAVERAEATIDVAFEELYAQRLRDSDVWLQFYTVGGDAPRFSGQPDVTLGTYRRLALARSASNAEFRIVERPEDLDAVDAHEARGLVLTIEGASPIGYELEHLWNFYALGLRSICLSWFRANQVCDGVGETRNGSLTTFGREVISEMNRLGMVVDISQASDQTVAEVLDCSAAPVIASHSNARGQYHHVRNLSDETISRIGASGGVVGITSYPAHVGSGAVGLEDLVGHIRHVVEVGGEQTPALGLNIMASGDEVERRFLGAANIEMTALHLPGLSDIGELDNLVHALRSAGFTDDLVEDVLWRNATRLLRAVL